MEIIDREALELMCTLMEQNAKDSAHLTNSLMEGYELGKIRAEVELGEARRRVGALFSSGYMPTPEAIFDALYPDQSEVEFRADNIFAVRKAKRAKR